MINMSIISSIIMIEIMETEIVTVREKETTLREIIGMIEIIEREEKTGKAEMEIIMEKEEEIIIRTKIIKRKNQKIIKWSL